MPIFLSSRSRLQLDIQLSIPKIVSLWSSRLFYMMKPAEQEIAVEEVRESTKPRIQVNTTKPQQVDDRWMEFKVIGKNIQPRSYHVAVVYGSYLYVHGGYDVDKGFLSDFYRLQLENQLDGFKW